MLKRMLLEAWRKGRGPGRDAASPVDSGSDAVLGWACLARGDAIGAERHARAALAREIDVGTAYLLLAALELPGMYYTEILARIHQVLRPRTYVEIGVFEGKSMALAGPETDVIGIDPAPQAAVEQGPRRRIVAMTSDAYFAAHDLAAELGGRPVELALIDGMHLCEFALRDFANLERYCAPGATILIHDVYPLDEASSSRERETSFWTGDTWRALLALRKYRPDLSVQTLASPPFGLAVVRRLDPASRVLAERMAEIEADMLATDFDVLHGAKSELLAVVPADRDAIDALFAARPA
ncbi:MAG: class I SAM-dependent methyltransferase [Betaproteobacteria bacterium]|nr:class I SAM-dependent methyltransferase [Betaproteobacteria bacterium]